MAKIVVLPPNSVYDISRKIFPMFLSINWLNDIVLLPLLLEILDDICIVIICCPGFNVTNFEINLSFFIK